MDITIRYGLVDAPHEYFGACLETLRAAVGAVAAQHFPTIGERFDVHLLPDNVLIDDDDGVARLTAGCCVEAVVWPQVLARLRLNALGAPQCDQEISSWCARRKRHVTPKKGELLSQCVRKAVDEGDYNKAGLFVAAYPGEGYHQQCVKHALQHPDAFAAMKANGLTFSATSMYQCPYPFPDWLPGVLQDDLPVLRLFAYRLVRAVLRAEVNAEDSIAVSPSVAAEYCVANVLDATIGWNRTTVLRPAPSLEIFLGALFAHGVVPDEDIFARLRYPITPATVHLLVGKGADVNAQDAEGWGILRYNLHHPGWKKTAAALLSCGLDIDAVGTGAGHTLLMEAATKYRTALPRLMELGADVHVLDAEGDSLLTRPARRGRWDVVELLLQDGRVDPNISNRRTLLELAIDDRKPCHLESVLQYSRVDVNAANAAEGITPTMLAASLGKQEALLLLLARSPDLSAVDDEGRTCLAHAVQSKKIALCYILLGAGAAVGGGTLCALEEAVMQGEISLVKMLLKAGADATRRCADGSRLLEYVTREDITKELVKYGAVEEESGAESAEEVEEEEEAEVATKKRAREDTPAPAVQSCHECAPEQAGEVFASADVLRRHVSQHHDIQWSEYVSRHGFPE